MMRIDLADWKALSVWAGAVRRAVFVNEQGIDETLEWDEYDACSTHAVAWLDDQAVATGRLLPDGKIGRMAVLKPFRHSGIGRSVLLALLALAREHGLQQVKLSAQETAKAFYTKNGFEPLGDPHMEVGIAHQWMFLRF
jgi:predicted GNAT family N-acyltransferase